MPKITISQPKLTSVSWAPEEWRYLTAARRIVIKAGSNGFIEETRKALQYIRATTTGKDLLRELFFGQHTVTINQGEGMAYVNTVGGATKNVVYLRRGQPFSHLENLFSRSGILIDEFAKDFEKLPIYTHDVPRDFNWVEFIQKWKSPSTSVMEKIKIQDINKVGKNGNDYIVACIQEFSPNQKNIEHIWNSVIMALYETSNPGQGSGVNVYFALGEDDESAVNKERPNAMGLAHELIHSYYSVNGLQPSGAGKSLDDLICIGIGPWKNKAGIYENNIRNEWNSTVYNILTKGDQYNHIKAKRRTSHMDIGTSTI